VRDFKAATNGAESSPPATDTEEPEAEAEAEVVEEVETVDG